MSLDFHPLRVVEVRRETADAIAVTLAPDEDRATAFGFTPGQHLTLRADIAGEDVRRNYSICVPPGGGLEVGIKRVPGGRFSNWAFETLKQGAVIEAMPPRGHFTWAFDPAQARSYLCFGGGSGITPILSLIEAGLATEPQSSFTLLYGNRDSSSIMFLDRLADLKDRFMDRFQVHHFLTAEADDFELFNGRLDEARIAEVLASLVDPSGIDVAFICGPGGMMRAAEEAMVAAGLPAESVLVERFTVDLPSDAEARLDQAVAARAEGVRVAVTIGGRRRSVEFHAERGSILENAREAGLPAPFACKAGVCATCRARLVSGEVHMRANYGLSAQEVAQGYVLTCQAVPLGNGVVLDYDA